MALKRGGNSKIGRDEALRIRERYAAGVTQRELARIYRLSANQIGRIVRGESWSDVPMATATPAQLEESAQRMWRLQQAVLGKDPGPRTGVHGELELGLDNARSAPADAALDELGPPMSAAERMARDAAKVRQQHPDNLLKELKGESNERSGERSDTSDPNSGGPDKGVDGGG